MGREYRYSRPADVEEQYLTPTDVKQFVFCPRVTYFTRVAGLKPLMGSQQEEAKRKHERVAGLERRRKSLLKAHLPFDLVGKLYDLPLISERLHLHGILDMLAITPDQERVPVEFKDMACHRGTALLDHKYQLVALALLVEDSFRTIVRRGLIHYAKSESTIVVQITHSLKRRAEKVLGDIQALMSAGTLPRARRECSRVQVGCGFADRCRGL